METAGKPVNVQMEKHLVVLAFGVNAASTRFRWEALKTPLHFFGWRLFVYPGVPSPGEGILEDADIVLLQKTLVASGKLKRIRSRSRVLLYDADDRIWHRAGRDYRGWTRWKIDHRLKRTCRSVDACLAANHVIASDLRKFDVPVHRVPMGIDLANWPMETQKEKVMGWSGSPKNLDFLESIRPDLERILERFSDWELHVFCGKNPRWSHPQVKWIPFDPERESQIIRTFDIGLCPLPRDRFVEGKSPVKLLHYWASGAVVCSSAAGAANEWLEPGINCLVADGFEQWAHQLTRLIQDPALRDQLRKRGRLQVQQESDIPVVVQDLVRVLDQYSPGATRDEKRKDINSSNY